MSEKFIHVSVGGQPDSLDLKRARDSIDGVFEEYEVLVTGTEVDIHEIPALDEFADQLADRVADRMDGEGE